MTTLSRPMSPKDRKQGVIILLVIAVGFFAFPFYHCCVELGYRLIGVTTTAQITETHPESRRAGKYGRRTVYVITYSFLDRSGQQRTERDELESDLFTPQVTVEYLPGLAGYSRIPGHGTRLWIMVIFFGTFGVLFGGMAWLTWKRKDDDSTATQSEPAKPTPVKKSLSRNVNYGWIIFGIVGAILIGLSLFGIFGEAGMFVVAGVIAIAVGLVAIEISNHVKKQHTDAMRNIARNLNLKFDPEGHQELHQSLKRFHLATLGPHSTMSNLMYGQRDGTDIAIFEYEYPRGRNNTIRQTVIWMQRRGAKMTEFSLRPEGVWNQLGGWSGHGDINFDSHPRFSSDYLLKGDDEAAIRELFTDEVLEFYERHAELITEGEGNKLLLYREGVAVTPEKIPHFLNEALALRELFSR